MKKGESVHHLLQAICRGKVRLCEGHRCPKSTVWLIADPRTGIEQLLPHIFPGCNIEPWSVSPGQLQKNLKGAYEFIKSKIEAGVYTIPVRQVREQLHIRDNYKFKRDVLNKPEFRSALDDLGGYHRRDWQRDDLSKAGLCLLLLGSSKRLSCTLRVAGTHYNRSR